MVAAPGGMEALIQREENAWARLILIHLAEEVVNRLLRDFMTVGRKPVFNASKSSGGDSNAIDFYDG